MTEDKLRSLAKAISWRVSGTFVTIIVAWIGTGRLNLALSIGVIEFFSKVAIYYVHERVWNAIPFGKSDSEESVALSGLTREEKQPVISI